MTNQPNLNHEVEQYLAQGGRIERVPGFTWQPLRESKRHPDPDRYYRRVAPKVPEVPIGPIPEGYLSFSEVIAMAGKRRNGGTHKQFLEQIDAGEFPPPDWISRSPRGLLNRGWLPETIELYQA